MTTSHLLERSSYIFNLAAIPTAVAAAALLLFGLLVWLREPTSSVKKAFLLTALAVGAWLFSVTWMYSAATAGVARWWAKTAYLIVPFICSGLYHLTIVALGINYRRQKLIWLSWIVSGFFAGASLGTNWLIGGVHHYWWGFYPKFNWLMIPFVMFFFSIILVSIWHFWHASRLTPPGVRRHRLELLLIAFAFTFLALFDYGATWGIDFYPAGYLPISGFLICIAVLILRHEFIDRVGLQPKEGQEPTTDAVLVFDKDGVITLANPGACQLFGHKDGTLTGQNVSAVTSGLFTQEVVAELLETGRLDALDPAAGVRQERLGNLSITASVIRDRARNPLAIVCILRDLREPSRADGDPNHQALYDPLTKLPNRVLFTDYLKHALGRAKRHSNYFFGVLFLDLDRFKIVNDSLGHAEGDQLLHAIARRLERCLRPGDAIARLGGDEFAILLDDIKDVSDATRIAERIHKEVTAPFVLAGQEIFTTASIGITLSEERYELPEQILRDADTAMYRAKALGKARHAIFDTGMHAHAVTQLKLEADLRRAVEHNEFLVHYQPIVSLSGGRVMGFEALVRWQHPTRGLIAPLEFIPVAEETGLIIPIGQWVLRDACRQLHAWNHRFPVNPPLSISVNLSSKQFLQPNLTEQIRRVLKESRLDPRHLRLEITESVIMEKAETTSATVHELKAMGIQLYIDDFGTGYSSLSYLHRFSIDALKIDRSFASRMHVSRKDLEIVRTIIALAQNLGIHAIAEGVETGEQLAQLRALKCEFGQGYFFSKPVAAEEADALMAAAFVDERDFIAPLQKEQ
ncbi:MAG TPA: EAL domain-containing protein [Nitrospiraceae bacterium]|jgi:diguanylate cyclase (GGDEF)-like protein/PAS domain S-box-containing protein|nr:EAL domain-containing protein [Nitrospiraceae bacterium]